MITISIVSHGQGHLVTSLLNDLCSCTCISSIILTKNLPIDSISIPDSLRGITTVISNNQPLGFGENHNNAFNLCRSTYFLVLNPDISITSDIFPELISLFSLYTIDLLAPQVQSPSGRIEDSYRVFPTFFGLVQKFFNYSDGTPVYNSGSKAITPVDWVAGMFMLFRSSAFLAVNGFDTNYFLYYEDVDLCVRFARRSMNVLYYPNVRVIHDARRDSRRKFKYMYLYSRSLFRYLLTQSWRLPRR